MVTSNRLQVSGLEFDLLFMLSFWSASYATDSQARLLPGSVEVIMCAGSLEISWECHAPGYDRDFIEALDDKACWLDLCNVVYAYTSPTGSGQVRWVQGVLVEEVR